MTQATLSKREPPSDINTIINCNRITIYFCAQIFNIRFEGNSINQVIIQNLRSYSLGISECLISLQEMLKLFIFTSSIY